VRPFIIVNPDKAVEAFLLLQEIEGSGLGGLVFQRQVHAFVTTVLFRVPWLDAFDVVAQAQPPPYLEPFHRTPRRASSPMETPLAFSTCRIASNAPFTNES